jgi:hypothetical protein
MAPKISKRDFAFIFAGHGHYKTFYQSPKTGLTWSKTITDMELIDRVKNSDNPKAKDLNELKRTIKN